MSKTYRVKNSGTAYNVKGFTRSSQQEMVGEIWDSVWEKVKSQPVGTPLAFLIGNNIRTIPHEVKRAYTAVLLTLEHKPLGMEFSTLKLARVKKGNKISVFLAVCRSK